MNAVLFEQSVRVICVVTVLLAAQTVQAAKRVTDPDTGIDWKVLITADGGTEVFDAPGGKSVSTLPEMQIRFVLKTEEEKDFATQNSENWYRISANGDEPTGWVKESAVSIWKTRSALKPNDISGRKFVVSNGKRGDGTSVKDVSADGVPDNYQMLAPILKPRDSENDPYSVLVFQAKTQGTLGEKIEVGASELLTFGDAKLELVFVIDTTASMTPLLDGVREVVGEIARQISDRKDESGRALSSRVRFGLVEYQDKTRGLTPSRVKIELSDSEDFLAELKNVRVADIGSDEWQEDVVAGLLAAVDRKDEAGNFGGSIGWSRNSSKQVFLCGDASALKPNDAKSSTGLSIEEVLKKARPKNIAETALRNRMEITFHAVMALNEDGELDWEECREDFQEVAQNLGEFGGFFADMRAKDPESRKEVVDEFVALLKLAVDTVAGKQPTQAELEESPVAKAYYRLADGTPLEGVVFGNAFERNENDQVVAVEAWFLRFIEMQRLKSSLSFILDNLKSLSATERKSSNSLLEAMAVAFATAGVGEPVGATELREIIKGLPLKNDVLNLTIDDIARMDDKEYDQWLTRMAASETRCEKILNIKHGGSGLNEWIYLGEKSSKTENLVTFVPIDQLP